jgi:hypothetical protein
VLLQLLQRILVLFASNIFEAVVVCACRLWLRALPAIVQQPTSSAVSVDVHPHTTLTPPRSCLACCKAISRPSPNCTVAVTENGNKRRSIASGWKPERCYTRYWRRCWLYSQEWRAVASPSVPIMPPARNHETSETFQGLIGSHSQKVVSELWCGQCRYRAMVGVDARKNAGDAEAATKIMF